GNNWGSLVVDLADVFFANLTVGAEVDGLHNGQLVTTGGSTDVWYVWDGELYQVEGTLPAFVAGDVRTVSEALVDAVDNSGETVTAAAVTANPAQRGVGNNPGEPGVTGELMVSLAASTPGSSTVPTGAE